MLISSAVNKLMQAVFASSIVYSTNNVHYNVVSLVPHDQTLGVVVDNQVYALTNNGESSLLYSGSAPVAQTGYRYVVLDNHNNHIIQQENFTRTPVSDVSTLYEHYNRTWNIMQMDPLPDILDPLPIIHRVKRDAHFDGQIPTIHLTGNQTAIDYIHKNPRERVNVEMNLTYISPTDVKQFENVALSIAGHSTRNSAKLSYKFKLPKKTDLYNYRRFKLRSMTTDPSYMRDELSYDVLNRLGMPTSKNSYARVYINDRAIGLFGLAEVFKNPWIRNEFGNGKKKSKQGAFYIADVSAWRNAFPDVPRHGSKIDLTYLGDNVTVYSLVYPPKENPTIGTANFTRLMDVTKFISEQPDASDNSAVALWEKKINVESFLRGLAHEIVVSNSDGYLTMANNYILYDDLINNLIVFSGQDFDLTMGTTMFNATLMNGGNYTEFPGLLTRPLTSKLLAVPKFRQKLEKLIVYITKNLVNLDVLGPRINQLSAMLAEDVEWDKSLPRVSNGTRPGGPGGPGVPGRGPNGPGKGPGGPNGPPGGGPGDPFGNSNISFSDAVNGSITDEVSVNIGPRMSLKEWIQFRSNNILTFFNETL